MVGVINSENSHLTVVQTAVNPGSHPTTSPFPQILCDPSRPDPDPLPAALRDLPSAHHDRLGQAVLRRADGAQGSSEQPSLSGGERVWGQRHAVQLRVGASPERPVDQRPLPLKGLLLTRLCGEREEEEVSCGFRHYLTVDACVTYVEVTGVHVQQQHSMIHQTGSHVMVL